MDACREETITFREEQRDQIAFSCRKFARIGIKKENGLKAHSKVVRSYERKYVRRLEGKYFNDISNVYCSTWRFKRHHVKMYFVI